ncbi:EPC2 [Cervus elaphus hippelaphus]|uniref:Enhancer of polycomb homolog n=1 Tax=Cervus elaphus hippelaphus TaxID=46360 RepID=A0A212C1V7_CEREH|nr:EPC2 [Cervus elaphus hippelaphus]
MVYILDTSSKYSEMSKEHHLQRAISAQQVFREKKESMVIPVPEAESNVNYYNRLYKGEFKQPKQFIHIQRVSFCLLGLGGCAEWDLGLCQTLRAIDEPSVVSLYAFNLDNEQPDYDMDSEDETLLNRLNRKMEIKPLQFEIMIDRLEKASSNQLVTLQEAKLLLNEDDYLIKAVYDYWVRKRKNCRGPSLIPQIKQEKRDGSTNNDPYVAFRRRTEKMQTRKNEFGSDKILMNEAGNNRKNDEASYEKMLKLRREFSRAITILEMIKRREKTKRELLHLTLEVVEKRYHLGDYGGEILNEVKINRSEKELYATPATLHNGNHHKVQECKTKVPSPASEPEEENDPDGPCAFRRRAGCQYYAPRLDQTNRSFGNSELADLDKLRYRHCLTTLTVPRRCIGFARRRIGRGGRVIMDRIATEHDPVLKQIDPEMLNGFSSASQTIDFSSNFSRTNASNKHCENRLSLSEILSNIRSCRLQCFQPRLLNLQDSDSEECTSRKPGQTVNNKRVSAASVALLNTSKNGISECLMLWKILNGKHKHFSSPKHLIVFKNNNKLDVKNESNMLSLSVRGHHGRAVSDSSTAVSSNAKAAACSASAETAISAFLATDTSKSTGTSKTLYSTNMALSSSPGISAVQLVRTVGHTTTNHLIPALCTSSPQTLPMNNSCLTNAVHLNNVSVVSPVNVHINTRTSAPSPTALKLATVAASMDRVPKVTPSSAISSIARLSPLDPPVASSHPSSKPSLSVYTPLPDLAGLCARGLLLSTHTLEEG